MSVFITKNAFISKIKIPFDQFPYSLSPVSLKCMWMTLLLVRESQSNWISRYSTWNANVSLIFILDYYTSLELAIWPFTIVIKSLDKNHELFFLHTDIGLDIQDDLGRHEVGFVDNTDKVPINNNEGCRFKATFKINKVRKRYVSIDLLTLISISLRFQAISTFRHMHPRSSQAPQA